jgi:hypothetical protein
MPKAGPKRPQYTLSRDLTAEETAALAFAKLADDPKLARRVKELADTRGTTVDVLVHEVIAHTYRLQGKPVPSELREYLAQNDPDMPEKVRESLTLGLN